MTNATAHLLEIPVAKALRKTVVDCRLTRSYQAVLDREIDALRQGWDAGAGLTQARDVELPHRQRSDYWLLARADRDAVTSEAAAEVYRVNAGRAGTAPLCVAAFCWQSPLSQHHQDAELLQYVTAGLSFFIDSIDASGLMASFGLNGESWAHGWDVEGLIYSLLLCHGQLADDLVSRALARFAVAAARMRELKCVPQVIGSYGNQRLVYALGLHLYGQVLQLPELCAFADLKCEDAFNKVIDASGQVIEQQGPCLHYSYTAFIYGWLSMAIRRETAHLSRFQSCLEWFRDRHTNSGWPIAGPSTRSYLEVAGAYGDLLPAAEQCAASDGSARQWLHDLAAADGGGVRRLSGSHAASTMMWAMLMCPGDDAPVPADRSWLAPRVTMYDATQLLKRFPLKYVLARQQYQTHFNCRDYLPFSGIQTWAWRDEPPIIHPTPLAPSTTLAYGIDTARQGVSHNWGGYGAGAVGIDGYLHREDDSALPFLIGRYDWLWCVVVFSDAATVMLEFGNGGARQRFWTLNRLAPATPIVADGYVRFHGRQGRWYTTVAEPPDLVELEQDHRWAEGVRQLVYDCGTGPTAFALAGDTVELDLDGLERDWAWRFSDASGAYTVRLDPQFADENVGNISIDPWWLTRNSRVVRD